MTTETTTQSAGWRMKVSAFALAAAVFSVLWFAIAALGTKWGWWPWQVGLGQMTIGTGPMITMAALGLSILAQIIALVKAPRVRPFIIALLATLISAMALFRLGGFGAQATALPPIHDIQTDWNDPVRYSDAIISAREAQGDTNPVLDAPVIIEAANNRWPGMGGKLVSVAQEEAEQKGEEGETVYPPIDPVYFDQAPADVAVIAQRIIESKGWEIVTPLSGQENSDTIQIEATAISGWFEFKDDVAIRIRAVEGATRVDMRSTSRVGLSDIGANSKRVYGFMMELLDRGDGRVED